MTDYAPVGYFDAINYPCHKVKAGLAKVIMLHNTLFKLDSYGEDALVQLCLAGL